MEGDFKALAKDIGLFKEDIDMAKEEATKAQANIALEIDGVKEMIVHLETQLSEYVPVPAQRILSLTSIYG